MFDTTKFENVASKMNNDSEADDTTENTMEAKLTPIEELRMELTTEGVDTYTSYEVFVDIGRWMAKEISIGNDQYEPVYDWAIENKKEYREKAADLPGNLPLFRQAFPAESRDVWVLPSAEAAKVGIDYDNEDHIVLPVINGKKWSPKTDFLPESEDSEETADEQPEVDGINPADFTIPELQVELLSVDSIDELIEIEDREIAGKDRKGALKAIEVAANGLEAEAEVEQESDDSEETAEVPAETDSTDVEAAKLEALTALTETLNAVNETVQSL